MTIFVSHRSSDKEVADILLDFLVGTGISKDIVFCSSLPGNDVNQNISEEVRTALQNSVINIAILSQAYYQSAYCLNEAGIIWYRNEIPVIPIALPEIVPENMYGFLGNDFKVRRLDLDEDVAYIYDTVRNVTLTPHYEVSVIMREKEKLKARYNNFLRTRGELVEVYSTDQVHCIIEDATDDEQIILYFILLNRRRKISEADICTWLMESEIYDVDVTNAFDLLTASGCGEVNKDTFALNIQQFREYTANSDLVMSKFQQCWERHQTLAVDTFEDLWRKGALNLPVELLFLYIIEEKIDFLGDAWMKRQQITHIQEWESKNTLNEILSSHYDDCLSFFIEKKFVSANARTSHGNVKEWTLVPSLKSFLLDCPRWFKEELQKVKDNQRRISDFIL